MKSASPLRILGVASSFLAVAVFGLSSVAYAATKPYLKTYGGDVFAGGWFSAASGTCDVSSAGNYQDPAYSSASLPQNDGHGGILTFANSDSASPPGPQGGSSAQYGAFALGSIDGDNSDHGFYSGGLLSKPVNYLSFANGGASSSVWGGLFQGGVRQSHCIPDYFDTKQNGATHGLSGSSPINVGSLSDKAYLVTATGTSNVSISGTVGKGQKTTIFVKGNVYIPADGIKYEGGYDADHVPKFALVVLGNIYIDPAVDRLDGVYIAQPDPADASVVAGVSIVSGNTGNIWTCHDNDPTDVLSDVYAKQKCNNRLTVNGSLIAKQINFLRTTGDLSGASAGEDSGSTDAAEVINYTPEMLIDGPFFNPQNSSTLNVSNLQSLPPLF